MTRIPTQQNLELGERVRYHRERRKPRLSQPQIAAAMATYDITMGEKVVRNIEQGLREMSPAEREAMAKILHTSEDFPMPDDLLQRRLAMSADLKQARKAAQEARKAALLEQQAEEICDEALAVEQTTAEIVEEVRQELAETELDELVDEAERGYDVLHLVQRNAEEDMVKTGHEVDWYALKVTCTHDDPEHGAYKATDRNPYCPCCNYGYAVRPEGRNTYLLCDECSIAWQKLRQHNYNQQYKNAAIQARK